MNIGGIELDAILLINIVLLGFLVFLVILIMQTWIKIRALLLEREEYDEDVKDLKKKIAEYNEKMSSLLEEAGKVRSDIKKKKVSDEMEKIMIKV